jgi:hypothetical protein
LLWLAEATVGAASLTATLDRNALSAGESATLSLAFDGGRPQGPVNLPPVNGLTFQATGNNSQITIINGQRAERFILTYVVTAAREGIYAIPPIRAIVNGQWVASAPLTLTVTKTDRSEIDRYAQFRLLAPKNEAFVGESLPFEVQLLYLAINGADQPQIPAESFTMGKLVQSQGQTIVNQQQWQTLSFKSFLVAARPGQLSVGPAEMRVSIPSQLQRDFFGRLTVASWRTVTLTSLAYPIMVHPVPATNVPPSFNGALGSFTMSVTATPTNVAVGDPITLKVQISGRGPIESLTLPPQPNWNEFKSYPPTSKAEISDQLGLVGSKSFEQVLVAQNTEVRELPPFLFSYFDTDKKSYRSLSGPAIPLIVRPSAAAQLPALVATNAGAPPPASDIVHIKPHLGALALGGPALVQRGWFWALHSLPALAWTALFLRRRWLDELANNPRLRRQREVARVIQEGLVALPPLADKQKAEEFFALVFRLLQEQLGERLDLPASAITEAVIEERLHPLGVPREILKGLQDLFQACNQARYGGLKSKRELAAWVPQVEKILQDLRAIPS